MWPPRNPIAAAYFRAAEWATPSDSPPHDVPHLSSPAISPAESADSAGIAAVVDLLLDAGVLPQAPRALISGGSGEEPGPLARVLRSAVEQDPATYSARIEELGYLANAIVSGCSIQGRQFSAREGSDAAVATCNLGLENWPTHWPPADDLVTAFQVGWAVLHRDVSMYVAERLIAILSEFQSGDREIQAGLEALRTELSKRCRARTPWTAGDTLDVIMILDQTSWAALVGLLGECPVIHGAMGASLGVARTVSSSAFEFISENRQLAAVRQFLERLPHILGS
jgi:hypothetical protein